MPIAARFANGFGCGCGCALSIGIGCWFAILVRCRCCCSLRSAEDTADNLGRGYQSTRLKNRENNKIIYPTCSAALSRRLVHSLLIDYVRPTKQNKVYDTRYPPAVGRRFFCTILYHWMQVVVRKRFITSNDATQTKQNSGSRCGPKMAAEQIHMQRVLNI